MDKDSSRYTCDAWKERTKRLIGSRVILNALGEMLMQGRDVLVTIYYMRSAISSVYMGEKWKRKVSIMPDGQVIAVYNKFLINKQLK